MSPMKQAFINMNARITATNPGLTNISNLITGSSTLLSHMIRATSMTREMDTVTAVNPVNPWDGMDSMLYSPVAMAMKRIADPM